MCSVCVRERGCCELMLHGVQSERVYRHVCVWRLAWRVSMYSCMAWGGYAMGYAHAIRPHEYIASA